MRTPTILSLLVTLILACPGRGQAPDGEGWISLFSSGTPIDHATGLPTGWRASENTECFSIQKVGGENVIVAHGKRSHLFYLGQDAEKPATFKNFEYKVKVMTEPGSNGGLYFHTAWQESGWPSHGHEVQVNNTFERDPRRTGSLYRKSDVPKGAHQPKDKEWFEEHIVVRGNRVVVRVNGRIFVDWTQPDAQHFTQGTFALQGHDPGSRVYYKDIRVKPLPDDVPSWTAPSGFVSLFDGKSLKGWEQINGTAKYEVADGTIKGTTVKGSPNSFLCSKPYSDFELHFEVKVDSRLNSGVQVRSNSLPEYRKGRVHGYQVEIATNGTAGFIYDEARRGWLSKDRSDPAARAAFKDGEWNRYRVVCVGDHIRTWVNGIPVADVEDAMTSTGFIGLQVHSFRGDSPASVQWRNIEIKELKPTHPKKVSTVVVTGGHEFAMVPFFKMFDAMPGVDYVEARQQDHSEVFEDIRDWPYDVILFYNMTQQINPQRRANLVSLLERGVGVVALHHTLAAYQEWPEFAQIIGGKYISKRVASANQPASSYKHDVDMDIAVKCDAHSITCGMSAFKIHDETYKGLWHAEDNHVLLTCDHPTSDEQVAWTRTYKNARIATVQGGHDAKAYANNNFSRILEHAIQWVAQH